MKIQYNGFEIRQVKNIDVFRIYKDGILLFVCNFYEIFGKIKGVENDK